VVHKGWISRALPHTSHHEICKAPRHHMGQDPVGHCFYEDLCLLTNGK